MGKKKKNSSRKGGNRFFRWIRSDLADEEDKKSPVLLLGVNKISESPYVRRKSIEGAQTSGSIRFFRPPKSKYARGLQGDERLEKIRQDLLTHKHGTDRFVPKETRNDFVDDESRNCYKLNCVSNCVCKSRNNSNRGSFSFRTERQSSVSHSEVFNDKNSVDLSENDIEFKYKQHTEEEQPSSSKTSYSVTPKSTERRSLLLANLNERFRKTLSLDSRKIETNRTPLSLPKESRPKSLVHTTNICIQNDPFVPTNFSKASQPKKKRKSFFSLDTFFDSKKSDSSSVDDFCSSKYKRFELESDDSPLFKRTSNDPREKTPDLLKLPVIIDSVRKKQSDTKKQLEKLENHYYRSLTKADSVKTVIDAVPKDAKVLEGPSGHSNQIYFDDDEVEYIEPIRSNFTSQSTLILDKNNPDYLKPVSLLTINTDDTEIRLPSSTVSPKSADVDSIGPYEIEVKEADLLRNRSKELTVKIMDKSVDSIGSCSLDVDASTDFSDTTSGSLNLLTPTSTTSRIKDFTSKIQERAASTLNPRSFSQTPTPIVTPVRTPENCTPTPKYVEKKSDNLLKPPPKVLVNDTSSHRSRTKKRDEVHQKKPSYLHLACSVNGYTNLTTYDSKLRQDINKSREASPIRPITHTYQYRSESNSLLVPVPVGGNKLIVPAFSPHDIRTDLTAKAPSKAHTDPYLATSPLHAFMANENKQLKNDFLNMATARPYMSTESKSFSTSVVQKDEVDDGKEITFKSSYSETNFRKTVSNGATVEKLASEYTISSNGVSKRVEMTKENGEMLTSPMKSFIQQRVERLYGPGALAQGFFNQKRYKMKSQSEDEVLIERSLNHSMENFNSQRKPFDTSECTSPGVSLPVLRHLRPEFRAQLPILSPKKSPKSDSPPKENIPYEKTEFVPKVVDSSADLVNGVSVIDLTSDVSDKVNGVKTNGCIEVVKDGHYFLELEKKETERLIALAVTAEKELEILQDNTEVSEEILGLLRSASGKARLLATQKMQQFVGLCYNNINERADEPFPTTAGDLQGFWDMVCLQVRNVEALYEHIGRLKANGWKELAESQPTSSRKSHPSSGRPASRPKATPNSEKAKAAAEKREMDRKKMLEHRRRVVRERQMAAAAPGGSEPLAHMGIEGAQEVEIFIGKTTNPSKVAPRGDCASARSDQSLDS